MGKELDSRIVENAEPIRIIVYPNKKRELQPKLPKDFDELTLEEQEQALSPIPEFYSDVVITYCLKDSTNKLLGYKKIVHEIDVSSDECTLETTKDEFATNYESLVAEDILLLSDVDITE